MEVTLIPRKSAFETHKDGPTLLTQLIAKEVDYETASKKLGITKSAISQYLKKFKKEATKAASEKYHETRPSLIDQEADQTIDELSLLQRNVTRLEQLVDPMHGALVVLFKDLRPDTLHMLDPRAMAWVAMTRSLVGELGRLLDRTMRAKAELMPEAQMEAVQRLQTQIRTHNDFIVEQGLEKKLEVFLRDNL